MVVEEMPPIFAHFATGFEDYEINRQCVEKERDRSVNLVEQNQEVVVIVEDCRASHRPTDGCFNTNHLDAQGMTGLILFNNTFSVFICDNSVNSVG
uniref:ZP domain-containing protein n=1 Tax=Heterorhabditis bacteriophora TaxID=37862 RepID=A0A1I7XQX9_HETBA